MRGEPIAQSEVFDQPSQSPMTREQLRLADPTHSRRWNNCWGLLFPMAAPGAPGGACASRAD
eukprot:8360298-Pyramimonas_sp.AAC.1